MNEIDAGDPAPEKENEGQSQRGVTNEWFHSETPAVVNAVNFRSAV